MTRIRSIVAGLVLALIVAAPVAATTQTSTMTLTVGTSISLSGLPASLAFTGGSNLPGGTATAPSFTLVYSTNGAAFNVVGSSTNLTGAGTIPKSAVDLFFDAADHFLSSPVTIDGPTTGGSKLIAPSIVIPADQAAGAYSGTLTVTAS